MRIAMLQRLVIPVMLAAGATLFAAPTFAASQTFQTQLSGEGGGSGTADWRYNPTTHRLSWTITYSGLSDVTMAHLHNASTGKPVIWLTKKGVKDNPSPIKGSAKLTDDEAKMLMDGGMYVNIHTKDHPSGAIKGTVMPPAS
jgi:hypothetical protein